MKNKKASKLKKSLIYLAQEAGAQIQTHALLRWNRVFYPTFNNTFLFKSSSIKLHGQRIPTAAPQFYSKGEVKCLVELSIGVHVGLHLSCCMVVCLCCAVLSSGTSWSAHPGCIAQQSNPDCEGLLEWPSCSGRLYGTHTEMTYILHTFVPGTTQWQRRNGVWLIESNQLPFLPLSYQQPQ